MDVAQDIDIAAGADRVWEILDAGFDDISTWAARMIESRGDDGLGDLGGRQVVTVEYGPATETLYLRDADERALGYHVDGPSLPPPISDVRTEWRVDAGEGDRSRVTLRFLAEVNPPEMETMLEEVLRSGIAPLLEELKHYAETGRPHANTARSAA
ncbi:MAG: SRPBCC family protein [Ilumatobacteraceae bacterium]